MSDTTDTVATSAAATAAEQSTDPGRLGRIPARDLVHLVQGLYFVFWGLLLSAAVGLHVMLTLWTRTFTEVFLAAGVLAILIGSWRLSQARIEGLHRSSLTERWQRRSEALLYLAILLVYFCVLFYMWRRSIGNAYLQWNALAFAETGILYLIMLSRTVATLAACLGSNDLALDSRLFNVSNIAVLQLPFVGGLFYVIMMSAQNGTNLLVEFNILLSRINSPVGLVFLLPLSLTLSVVWAAKDVALRRLAEIDEAS